MSRPIFSIIFQIIIIWIVEAPEASVKDQWAIVLLVTSGKFLCTSTEQRMHLASNDLLSKSK